MKKQKRTVAANAVLVCIILFVVLEIAVLAIFIDMIRSIDTWEIHEKTNIAEYGEYISVKHDGYMTENIDEIMPSKIEDFFIVQKYSYRMCHDPAFQEVYLEVVIEDGAQYQAYVNELTHGKTLHSFWYDPSFSEVILTEDRATVTMRGNPDERSSYVDYAIIQKIMFCNQTNTIIFLSLDVPDTYFANPPSQFYYFERFGIDVSSGKYHSAQ